MIKGIFRRIDVVTLMLLVSVLSVAVPPLYTVFYVQRTLMTELQNISRNEAERVATHLAGMLLKDKTVDIQFKEHISALSRDLNIYKVHLFAPSGMNIFSTDPSEIGRINEKDYFRNIVAAGNTYTKLVRKDALSAEGVIIRADVVETYVPIMSEGRFVGAFEIYYDITDRVAALRRLLWRIYAIVTAITAILTLLVLLSVRRARRIMAERRRIEATLAAQNIELTKINARLDTLYKVSASVSGRIGLDELLMTVLHTITEMELFAVQRKGGIFITDGERLILRAHLGHTEEFLRSHEGMVMGQCLCGISAQSGKVVVSLNSSCDECHTFRYKDMQPHGHIIVPLKSQGAVVGVLYLYTPPDVQIEDDKIKLLEVIGTQVGAAIQNSRLYEETKALSLHDPLTGLGNRRRLDVAVERHLPISQRYGRPLSVVMMDVDYFKRYNDQYGHDAGDMALKNVAESILCRVRASDLVIRYGGEEFLVLLSETGYEDAMREAERLRKVVEEETNITASFGVASFVKGETFEDLVKRADLALYRAKQNGRNRVEGAATANNP